MIWLAAASGLLWVLASPPFGLWPLGWIAMAPLLWGIARAPITDAGARTAGWYGWVAGAVTTAGGFHWIAEMIHVHGKLPWVVGFIGLVAFAAYQGLAMLLAARLIFRFRAAVDLPMAVIAPVVVVATEQAFPVLFPYSLAISQANALPVIQIADVLGAAAITALLIAAAGAIVDGWRTRGVVAALIAATAVYGFVRIDQIDARRAAAAKVQVGLVQPNEPMRIGVIDRARDRRLLEAMQRESARLEAAGAELIVWSETSYPLPLPHALDDDRFGVRRGFTAPLVFGAMTFEKDRRYNTSFLLDGKRIRGRQDKVHRVLGSEYNPIGEWTGWFPVGFSGGDGPEIMHVGNLRLGVLICLEDTLGNYAREVGLERPNLLVNQTIDTWFGTFAEPYQHRALARLRAVEQRADLVRSVNTGPSGLVTATGALGPQLPVRDGEVPVEGVLVEAAVMEAGRTIYAAIGDLFAWLCVAFTLAGWLLLRARVDRVTHDHADIA